MTKKSTLGAAAALLLATTSSLTAQAQDKTVPGYGATQTLLPYFDLGRAYVFDNVTEDIANDLQKCFALAVSANAFKGEPFAVTYAEAPWNDKGTERIQKLFRAHKWRPPRQQAFYDSWRNL